MNDIKLKKFGEQEENSLPHGVKVIRFGNRLVFARRVGGRFVPLPENEQELLFNKHVK